MLYEFGPFRLDVDDQRLFRGDHPVPLQRKPFLLLKLLIEAHPRLLRKAQIMAVLWPDTFVEESNIHVHIHTLRAILDEVGADTYIENVPGIGFRFQVDVRQVEPPPPRLGSVGPLLPPQQVIPNSQDRRAWGGFAATVAKDHLARPVEEYPYAIRPKAVPMSAAFSDTFHSDAVELLLANLKPRAITLLIGEYGSGKTYLAGALAYRLAQAFMDNPDGATLIPVIVPLRQTTSLSNLDSLIQSSAFMLHGVAPGLDFFAKARSAGRLALILDGLDEMIARTDRKDLFFHLDPLVHSAFFAATPIVITLRPNVIPSRSYYERVRAAYTVVTLDPLDEPTVEDYLRQQHLGGVLERLRSNRDAPLLDLLSRPLYVEMLAATAERICATSAEETLSLSRLYDFYFEYWYIRELRNVGKAPGDLDSECVKRILSGVALRMSTSRKPFISEASLHVVIESVAEANDRATLTAIFVAAKERLILVPEFSDDGIHYSFRHDSLRSYFYAVELARTLHTGAVSNGDLAGLDAPTVDFLFSVAQSDHALSKFLSADAGTRFESGELPGYRDVLSFLWDRRRGAPLAAGRIQWLCSGDEGIRGIVVSSLAAVSFAPGLIFHQPRLANAVFHGSSLERVVFRGGDLTLSDFRGTNLERGEFVGAKLDDGHFDHAHLEGCTMRDITASRVRFSNAQLSAAVFTSVTLTNADMSGATLIGIRAVGAQFVECNFAGADLRTSEFRECKFIHCRFTQAIITGVNFDHCEFGKGDDLSEAVTV